MRAPSHPRWLRSTAALLALGLAVLTGCWPGRTMGPAEFEYVHPSVRWAYETGGQIGNKFVFIAPIRNVIYSLESGPECVVVEEGCLGCMEIGWWRPRYALDLQTGRLTIGQPDGRDDGRVDPKYRTPDSLRIDLETQLVTPAQTRDLYVGRPGAPPDQLTLLLRGKPEQSLIGVDELVQATDEMIVISLGNRYVVCIDLTQLPAHNRTIRTPEE